MAQRWNQVATGQWSSAHGTPEKRSKSNCRSIWNHIWNRSRSRVIEVKICFINGQLSVRRDSYMKYFITWMPQKCYKQVKSMRDHNGSFVCLKCLQECFFYSKYHFYNTSERLSNIKLWQLHPKKALRVLRQYLAVN